MVKKNNFFEGLNLFNNKSAKKSYNGILIIAGIFGVLFLVSLVPGTITINEKLGTQGVLTINEDVSVRLNISINSSLAGITKGNVSEVNITIPGSFTFTTGSNYISNGTGLYTSTENATFNLNSSTLLIWTNTTNGFMTNGSNGTLGFNITAANPGNYTINITYKLLNDVTENNTYINITVNDTTAPRVVFFNSQNPVSYANLSVREIIVNVSANDTFSAIGSFNISLLFPNGSLANNTLHKGALLEVNDSVRVNFTGIHLTDGQYIINVSNVSDNAYLRGFGSNNTNMTGIQRNVTIDLTAPTVTVVKSSSSTAHQIVLDVTVTDATSGIVGKQCTASGSGTGATSVSGTGGSQTATQTGLGCNTAYTYTVTCSDHSGNSGSKQVTVNTDGCSSGSSSSGTGTGGSGSDVVG